MPHACVLVPFVQPLRNFLYSTDKILTIGFFDLPIDAKIVITDANPMPLVHFILYRCCTTGIGFALVITFLASIETKDYTHVFSVAVQFLLQATWNLIKKLVDRQTFVTKHVILDRLKLDRTQSDHFHQGSLVVHVHDYKF